MFLLRFERTVSLQKMQVKLAENYNLISSDKHIYHDFH